MEPTMEELATLTAGDASITLSAIRGQVVGASKAFSTQIGGRGDAADVKVWSANTEHNQFFLRNGSGQEKEVRVVGELALRDGHDVSVVWGIRSGEGEESCVAVINHSTGKTTMRPHALEYLAFGKRKDRSVSGCVGVAVSVWGMLMGAALVLFALSSLAERGSGGYGLILLLAGAGVALVLFGWKQFRRPWSERDKRFAVHSRFESEVGAVVARLAAG